MSVSAIGARFARDQTDPRRSHAAGPAISAIAGRMVSRFMPGSIRLAALGCLQGMLMAGMQLKTLSQLRASLGSSCKAIQNNGPERHVVRVDRAAQQDSLDHEHLA